MKFFLIRSFITFVIFQSFWGCKPGEKHNHQSSVIDSLYRQVMVIHDEVMPKMGHMMELQDNLKSAIQSASTGSDTIPQVLLNDLANAEEAMWAWMNNLKQINTLPDSFNAVLYYRQQIDSILLVKKQMLESIGNAESYLNHDLQ